MFRTICAMIFAVCLGSPAKAETVGNFIVKTEKDPMDDSERYIAITVHKNDAMAVRCLEGELSLSFIVKTRARVGDDVDIKFRLDSGPVTEAEGSVISVNGGLVGFETGTVDFITKMGAARQLAIRWAISGVGTTASFDLRGISAVVAGARKACKLKN